MPSGKVVLVRLSYAKGWRLPGGGQKTSEESRDAMLRELREEIGLTAYESVELVGALSIARISGTAMVLCLLSEGCVTSRGGPLKWPT